MAASHSYLQYATAGSMDRNSPRRIDSPEGIRLVLGLHRILLKFTCPSHTWNWPRPLHGERLEGYDAHQTCFKCMTERFYNTQMLQAGPLYRRRVPEAADALQHPLAGLPTVSKPKLGNSTWKRVLRMRKSRVEA